MTVLTVPAHQLARNVVRLALLLLIGVLLFEIFEIVVAIVVFVLVVDFHFESLVELDVWAWASGKTHISCAQLTRMGSSTASEDAELAELAHGLSNACRNWKSIRNEHGQCVEALSTP